MSRELLEIARRGGEGERRHFLQIFRNSGGDVRRGRPVRTGMAYVFFCSSLYSCMFSLLFFLSLQGLGESLGLGPDFLVSHLLAGRAIHWRLQQCRGFWKMVYRALQSPRRLASRQFLLSRLQALPRVNSMEICLLFSAVWYVAVALKKNWFGLLCDTRRPSCRTPAKSDFGSRGLLFGV